VRGSACRSRSGVRVRCSFGVLDGRASDSSRAWCPASAGPHRRNAKVRSSAKALAAIIRSSCEVRRARFDLSFEVRRSKFDVRSAFSTAEQVTLHVRSVRLQPDLIDVARRFAVARRLQPSESIASVSDRRTNGQDSNQFGVSRRERKPRELCSRHPPHLLTVLRHRRAPQ